MYAEAARFSLGIIILLASSYVFIEVGKKLANIFRISNLIIGVTLIALGTSLPELAVSTAAVINGNVGLAVGNIVGSNIINILLVFPVGVLIGNLRVGTEKTQRNLTLLFFVTLLFIALSFISLPNYFKGIILLAGALVVTMTEYAWGVNGRIHEDKKRFLSKKVSKISLFDFFVFLLSLAGIVYGGILTASSSEEIALITGYSTTVIGLTLTAISTSLPEMFFTIIGQREQEEKLILGNIIGSNLYNLLLIGGVIYIFSEAVVLSYEEYIVLPLATVLFIAAAHAYKGTIIPRKVSIIFLILFTVYVKLLSIR